MNMNIVKLLNTQLDGQQMIKLTKCPIIKYPQFNDMTHIDEAFTKNNHEDTSSGPLCLAVIIYFEIEDVNSGHWCCMIKNNNQIEFFDPYGLKQDDEFNYMTMHKRKELNEQFKPLSKLLQQSGYKIIHNPYKIQKFEFPYMGQTIRPQTCGRHSVLRLINRKLTLEQHILDTYIKNHKLGNDDIISCYLLN